MDNREKIKWQENLASDLNHQSLKCWLQNFQQEIQKKEQKIEQKDPFY